MAIPDYQSIMLPLLKFVRDGKEHTMREATDALTRYFNLTEEERTTLLPSGQQLIFDNRVGWARTYMKKAGLLDTPRRACIVITRRGQEVLSSSPPRIDVEFLEQFPEFQEFRAIRREKPTNKLPVETPREGHRGSHPDPTRQPR